MLAWISYSLLFLRNLDYKNMTMQIALILFCFVLTLNLALAIYCAADRDILVAIPMVYINIVTVIALVALSATP